MFGNLIDKALALEDLPQGKFRHFSFLLRRNKIVSIGWNAMFKTHPWALKYGYEYMFRHSEQHCLLNFHYPLSELRKHKLVNVRIGKKGQALLSKPCSHCINMLANFNIGEVWFTNEKGEFVQL